MEEMMFSPFLTGVLASLAAGLATGVGALPLFALRTVDARTQDMMLGFGAGVMLAASFFSLLNPALAEGTLRFDSAALAATVVVTGFLSGGLLFFGADHWLPHEHFIAGPEGADPHKLRRIWLFVIAITIHNFPEGLSVGVGFGSGNMSNGLALTIGIALQNMPEGLVVALALAAEGYRRWQAFTVALLTGLVEPVGAVLGAGIVTLAAGMLPWMLALAAGAMIYVISDEIIPETHRKGFQKEATGSVMVGFVVMMFLDVVLAQ
ncbi:MAG: ZIP family metal transporter [Thiohalomonadaceae bacterium]